MDYCRVLGCANLEPCAEHQVVAKEGPQTGSENKTEVVAVQSSGPEKPDGQDGAKPEIDEKANEAPVKLEECPICASAAGLYRRKTCGHGACPSCWAKHCTTAFNKRGGASLYIQGKGVACLGPHKAEDILSPEEMSQVEGPELALRVKQTLATIPDTVSPMLLRELGYEYNKEEQLRGIETKEPYIFVSQRHYDALGDCVVEHIFHKMEAAGLQRVVIPEKKSDKEATSKIFMSPDALSADTLVILIHGSGAVRAGMWARALCINDNLHVGSMLPYIHQCQSRGWATLVLNCNENAVAPLSDAQQAAKAGGKAGIKAYYMTSTKPDLTPDYRKKGAVLVKGNEDPIAHTLYVYDNFITHAKAKNIFIVAHSAGGHCTMQLMNERTQILSRLKGIAFTDSVHSVSPRDAKPVKQFMRSGKVCNWGQSRLPLDTELRGEAADCRNVSAGHHIHEWTSSACMTSVFPFFEAILKQK